jgi:hypothetical protein
VSLLLGLGLVCGGTAAFVLAMRAVAVRREPCPTCQHKALRQREVRRATVELADGRTAPAVHVFLRCDTCHAEFWRRDRGGLVPKAAWDAGAREPLATATIVKRDE